MDTQLISSGVNEHDIERKPLTTNHSFEHPFDHILDLQKNYSAMPTAVVHPTDENSLIGALEAAEQGIIEPVLVGPEHKIRATAEVHNLDLSGIELVATEHSHHSAEMAVDLVRQGLVQSLMKGKLHTDELMEVALHKTKGLRTERRMSHVFAMAVPTYHKLLFLTDAAINIFPNLMTKKDITQNAVDLFLSLGQGKPKVAVVSAVETVTERIPSTIDATALCKMAERGQITNAIIDGPLGFDNAISKVAAEAKGIVSEVAGDADIILVPDLESGNMLYKQMSFLSQVESAGIVLGARVPIILTSRATGSGLARLASSALGTVWANRDLLKQDV